MFYLLCFTESFVLVTPFMYSKFVTNVSKFETNVIARLYYKLTKSKMIDTQLLKRNIELNLHQRIIQNT